MRGVQHQPSSVSTRVRTWRVPEVHPVYRPGRPFDDRVESHVGGGMAMLFIQDEDGQPITDEDGAPLVSE